MGKFEEYSFFAHFRDFPIILNQNLIFQTISLVIMALCIKRMIFVSVLPPIGMYLERSNVISYTQPVDTVYSVLIIKTQKTPTTTRHILNHSISLHGWQSECFV